VTIATPPHTHAGVALAAVAAEKHVICEKPFARADLRTEPPRAATFGDGVAGMVVLDAVRRSAAEGTWVPVPAG
jgi:predicted dehydrogenase